MYKRRLRLNQFLSLQILLLTLPQAVLSQPMGLFETPGGQSLPSSPDPSWAGDFGDGVIDSLRVILETYSKGIGVTAMSLLVLMLVFDLVVNVGRAMISDAGGSLGDVLTRFVFRVLFVLFAMFVITNISDAVKMAGDAAVSLAAKTTESPETFVEPSVSQMLVDGLEWAWAILGEVSIWKPLSVTYILCALLMLVVTACMVGMVVVTYAELYIGTLAGLIVLAFAGFEGTKDAATRYIASVIGKGLALLTLLITYSVFARLMVQVAGADSAAFGLDNVLVILTLQIIGAILILRLPPNVEALAGGVGSSGAGTMVGIAAGGLAMKAAKPLAAGMFAAGAGGFGAVGAATKAALGGKGIAGIAKAAGSGAAKTAGRYGGAYFSRGRSMTGEAAGDVAKYGSKIIARLRK